MKRKLSNKEMAYSLERIEAFGRIIIPIIRPALFSIVLIFLFYFLFKSIEVLGGKDTTAKLFLKFIGDIKISEYVAYAIAILGSIYGFREHSLRKNFIKNNAPRIKELEEKINPNRGSSLISVDGSTRRGDVI